jgi:hypothetical protein
LEGSSHFKRAISNKCRVVFYNHGIPKTSDTRFEGYFCLDKFGFFGMAYRLRFSHLFVRIDIYEFQPVRDSFRPIDILHGKEFSPIDGV